MLETVLESTVNPQARKPTLSAADALNRYGTRRPARCIHTSARRAPESPADEMGSATVSVAPVGVSPTESDGNAVHPFVKPFRAPLMFAPRPNSRHFCCQRPGFS